MIREFEGRPPVSKRTVDIVMSKLLELGHPATIRELVELTGRTYNTVKAALQVGGANGLGEFPERYEPGDYGAQVPVNNAHLKGIGLVVPMVSDTNDFTSRWNKGREVFGERLMQLVVHPDADPTTLISQFASGASTLATMAHQLEQVSDQPDWYERLMEQSNG